MKVQFYARMAILLFLVLFISINSSFAQDIEQLKKGVVKIEATTFEEKRKVGTGFIIRLEQDAVYIATAAHVVEGAREVEVEFFTQRNLPVSAKIINMEGGDPQGLAVILVRGDIPPGISVLKLTNSDVRGGEPVTTIGFPRISGVPWAVIKGDIVGRKGKTITFSGAVDEGNSGGPLIKEGQVVGVVTEVTEKFAYAIPTHIAQYVLEGWGVEAQVAVSEKPTSVPPPSESPTPTLKEQPPSPARRVWTEPITDMEFVWIEGGCFMMGQSEEEKRQLIEEVGEEGYKKWYSDELPRHKVCVDGFWMGKYEVTNKQYRKRKSDHDSKSYEGHSLNGDDQPVVYVSWEDAKAFTKWLTEQHGRKYEFRLPTEAEWEYAARAGTTTIRYWGNDPDDACQYGNVYDRTSKQALDPTRTHHECNDGFVLTAPVGRFRPNAFGLYDMLGNVWEWCEDIHSRDAYNQHQHYNPIYTGSGSKRVLRSGTWFDRPRILRSANRTQNSPTHRNRYMGIRLVRDN